MSSYTARIELHSENYSDFEILHTAMQNQGFSRLITSDDGITYHLPRAEYNISTYNNLASVLELAKKAVAVTRKTAEILVTESARRTWSGLAQVK